MPLVGSQGAGDAMGLGDKENSGRMGESRYANGILEEFQALLLWWVHMAPCLGPSGSTVVSAECTQSILEPLHQHVDLCNVSWASIPILPSSPSSPSSPPPSASLPPSSSSPPPSSPPHHPSPPPASSCISMKPLSRDIPCCTSLSVSKSTCPRQSSPGIQGALAGMKSNTPHSRQK